jgi:hypothetical protein
MELICELGGNRMPHGRCLRIAVQQQKARIAGVTTVANKDFLLADIQSQFLEIQKHTSALRLIDWLFNIVEFFDNIHLFY